MLSSVLAVVLLASTCAVCAVAVWRTGAPAGPTASLGLGLLGVAAALGAVRYGGVEAVTSAHRLASGLGGGGLAVVGAALGGSAAWFRTDRTAALMGVSGAVLEVVFGLAIGTRGRLWGLPRMDLFHMGLAAAVALMALGWVRAVTRR